MTNAGQENIREYWSQLGVSYQRQASGQSERNELKAHDLQRNTARFYITYKLRLRERSWARGQGSGEACDEEKKGK